MPRFITVTLNPALDYTLPVWNLAPGEVNRAGDNAAVTAGGKGVNVARVLRTLGADQSDVIATGLIGGDGGATLLRLLDAEQIAHDFADISPHETRLALLLIDNAKHNQTVINEPGPNLQDTDLPRMRHKLSALIKPGDAVLFCGSRPPGLPQNSYSTLIIAARSAVASTILFDSSGQALGDGVSGQPDILKVNAEEFASLKERCNITSDAPEQEVRRSLALPILAVTRGKDGAILASESGSWRATMPALDIVSAVGSGDSFSAGLVYSLAHNPSDYAAALTLACSCGGANALSVGAGRCSREQIEALSGKIKVERVA